MAPGIFKPFIVSSVPNHQKEWAWHRSFQSKIIVEAHKGRVEVASFSPAEGPPSGFFATPKNKLMKPKLLIVDDDVEIRRYPDEVGADGNELPKSWLRKILHQRGQNIPRRTAVRWCWKLELGLPPPARHSGGGSGDPDRTARQRPAGQSCHHHGGQGEKEVALRAMHRIEGLTISCANPWTWRN